MILTLREGDTLSSAHVRELAHTFGVQSLIIDGSMKTYKDPLCILGDLQYAAEMKHGYGVHLIHQSPSKRVTVALRDIKPVVEAFEWVVILPALNANNQSRPQL